MVIGAAALSGPMIRLIVRRLRARSALLDPVGRLVVAHLERAPRGTALTVTTLGIGLGTVIMVGTLGWSFEKSIVSVLTDRYAASLVITSAFVRGAMRVRLLPMSCYVKLVTFLGFRRSLVSSIGAPLTRGALSCWLPLTPPASKFRGVVIGP
jgi:hypothetical protein